MKRWKVFGSETCMQLRSVVLWETQRDSSDKLHRWYTVPFFLRYESYTRGAFPFEFDRYGEERWSTVQQYRRSRTDTERRVERWEQRTGALFRRKTEERYVSGVPHNEKEKVLRLRSHDTFLKEVSSHSTAPPTSFRFVLHEYVQNVRKIIVGLYMYR